MKKKLLGATIACLSLVVCCSLGMSVVSADDGNGPAPRVCSDPICWGI